MEMLPDHGRHCFVWLLEYQPLTDGVCDDVLDEVEGIAGETVIELTQEENCENVDCWLQGIQPCKWKGKGHQWIGKSSL
jgi:hypothetical protein